MIPKQTPDGLNYIDTGIINDLIHHPSHYTDKVPGIECKDVIKHFSYFRGAAIKYVWRAGLKDPSKEIEDLEKAIECIKIEIDELKAHPKKP